jgi:TetR/AcrR family transcriptional regulator, copper-responsive repressor
MVQKSDSNPRGRGRPRAYDPEVALSRAVETFWANGYAGTSLDDLSAAMGMNRPSLYAAFGDKRDLYLKSLAFYRQQSATMIRNALADDPSLREFMRRFYSAALDSYRPGRSDARGCFLVGTATTEAAADPEVREILGEGVRKLDELFVKRIRLAIERGEIDRKSDPQALAYLASGTLHTLAHRARSGLSRRELERLIDSAIAVICGGAA